MIDAEDAQVFLTLTIYIYYPTLWEGGVYIHPPAH